MDEIFRHRIPNFNPVGVLQVAGITPTTYPVIYFEFVNEVFIIIEYEVLFTAELLNKRIIDEYRRDMSDIAEYSRFPRYIQVMEKAISNPNNIGIFWDARNTVQAKFIDTKMLGDMKDLQAIQKMVHPGGTLEGWRGIYISWLYGKNNKYEEIISQRLDLMEGFEMFPLWEIIEEGNDSNALPTHRGKHTLKNFRDTYNKEMVYCFQRCISRARTLARVPQTTYRSLEPATVRYNNQIKTGYSWVSRSGHNVFMIAGSEKMLGNTLRAEGFMLSPTGEVLKRWSGWLPK